MEKPKRSAALAEALGGSEGQRGVKLGIIAAGIELFLLFGGSALLGGNSAVFDPERGQFAPLVVNIFTGFLALAIAVVLAYYAGLSSPEAKQGETGRTGLLAGATTMLIYWIGQSIFALVSGARSPGGLALGSYLQSRLITGLGFFVLGGVLGWWGSRASMRRTRSILSPTSSSMLALLNSSADPADSSAKIASPDLSSRAIQEEAANAGAAEEEGAGYGEWGTDLEDAQDSSAEERSE